MSETTTATRPSVSVREAPNPNLPATVPANGQQTNTSEIVMQEPSRPTAAYPTHYPPKIAKALIDISKKVGSIEKQGWNVFQKYHYQRWDDILNEVSPLLAEHGLLIQQSEVASAVTHHDELMQITYEFTIVSASGDVWPDRARWKAVTRLRDSKGVYDDKAANKCHTQASKYFLLHLFKIKTEGNDSDGDAQDAQAKVRKAPDPENPAAAPTREAPRGVNYIGFREAPREVNANGPGPWADRYIEFIAQATSVAEIKEWGRLNESKLDKLEARWPDIHTKVSEQVAKRIAALTPAAAPAPAPAAKPPAAKPAAAAAPDPDIALFEHGVNGAAEPPQDHTSWLNDVSGAFSSCESLGQFVDAQVSVMAPAKGKVSTEAWAEAQKLAEATYHRVKNN